MFTNAEISEMFRMGTLNGKQIERGKILKSHNRHAQFSKCVVTVNREYYEITQTFPYKENAKSNKHSPEITVYYEIKPL